MLPASIPSLTRRLVGLIPRPGVTPNTLDAHPRITRAKSLNAAGDRFTASGFAAVDSAADAERYIAYLDEQAATPFWRALKHESIEALELRPGMRALDVGCGTGDEVAAIGDDVAAVGVDASRVLLDEARRRAPRAEFVQARAEALPFDDGSFDAVRVERTLQHVDDVDAAIAEMRRVARPGAAIVAVEPDWETLVIDHPASDLVRERWAARINNPRVGRELARRLGAESVEARTSVIGDVDFAERQLGLRELVDADVLAEFRARPFLAAVTYFLAVARPR